MRSTLPAVAAARAPVPRRMLVLAAAIGLAAVCPILGTPAAATDRDSGWTGTWQAAPTRAADTELAGYSIRNVVHVGVGGSAVRLRLSNAYGTAALRLAHVTVARQADGENSPRAAEATMREVTFAGQAEVTAPAGRDVVSDPVELTVPARSNLLVTVYTPADAGSVTYHSLAQQTSFLSPGGDRAADPTGETFNQQTSSWYYLTGVDVRDSGASGSVVVFGDSIAEGYMSTYGTNARWPDRLAARLAARPVGERLSVQNAGISGNRLLLDGMIDSFGVKAIDRFEEDVLSRTGVRTVVVMLGINDIQQPPNERDSSKINSALAAISARARAEGIRVIGATLTPFKGWSTYDDAQEAVRIAVNEFIRTTEAFDAVIDFDAALRDPADPHRMLAAYDSGDGLHPGDAGYAFMGDLVDLSVL